MSQLFTDQFIGVGSAAHADTKDRSILQFELGVGPQHYVSSVRFQLSPKPNAFKVGKVGILGGFASQTEAAYV